MKILYTGLCLILTLFYSCSTIDDALVIEEEPVPTTTTSDVLLSLVDSDWELSDCPDQPSLLINGYNECQYLDRISFTESIIYTKNVVNSYLEPHNICAAYDDNLVLSKQSCNNPKFEWKIISHDENSMTIEVTAPNINPDYSELFEYERVG